MNKIIKIILNYICHLLTLSINKGQLLVCMRERNKMWGANSKEKWTNEEKEQYARNKDYLRQYGFKSVKGDFRVFYNFFKDKGHDPKFIIPQYIIHNYLTPLFNPISYNAYFSDKNNLDKIFPSVNQPKTILRRIGGTWYDRAYNPLEWQKVKDYLEKSNEIEGMVVKPSRDSASGRGVRLFRCDGGKWTSYENDTSFWQLISSNYWNQEDLILQEVVKQSAFLNKFCDTSVNTFRLVIYNSPIDNESYYIWSGLRVGRKGSLVDNNHAGGLIFGVDREGRLASYGTNQYGDKESELNGTDYSGGNLIIPNFNAIVEFAISLSKDLIPNRFIAFDVTLDNQDNPLLIECNLRGYSGWLCQFAGDNMFGDKTDEILKYLSRNRSHVEKVFYKIN